MGLGRFQHEVRTCIYTCIINTKPLINTPPPTFISWTWLLRLQRKGNKWKLKRRSHLIYYINIRLILLRAAHSIFLYIYIALVYKTTSEMFNQDTLICPNGVHNGEVPLCIPPLEPLYNLHLKRLWSV